MVKQCSPYDATHIQIAKGRVSPELAVLIHSKQTTQELESWTAFQSFLRTEFTVEVNVDRDRAWQELEAFHYDWVESPQAFTNKFICQHAMLITRFPRKYFPNRDKTIKGQLCKLRRGMPAALKEKLEGFLDDLCLAQIHRPLRTGKAVLTGLQFYSGMPSASREGNIEHSVPE